MLGEKVQSKNPVRDFFDKLMRPKSYLLLGRVLMANIKKQGRSFPPFCH